MLSASSFLPNDSRFAATPIHAVVMSSCFGNWSMNLCRVVFASA